jgi:hypothetical protein
MSDARLPDPSLMNRAELISECRRLGVSRIGGLSRAAKADLVTWVRMARPRVLMTVQDPHQMRQLAELLSEIVRLDHPDDDLLFGMDATEAERREQISAARARQAVVLIFDTGLWGEILVRAGLQSADAISACTCDKKHLADCPVHH